jgi:hypothetical protein
MNMKNDVRAMTCIVPSHAHVDLLVAFISIRRMKVYKYIIHVFNSAILYGFFRFQKIQLFSRV